MEKIHNLPTDFFEKIELSTLNCMTDKFVIKSKEYHIFSYENKFRGIKQSSNNGEMPFFMTHQELFDTACLIYEKMYQSPPEYIYYFHDNDKMWNAFIVSGYDFDLINTYKNSAWGSNTLIQVGDIDGFPAIGAFNSYEMNDNPAFFYVVTSPVDNRSTFLTIDNFRFRRSNDRNLLLTAKKNNSFHEWMVSFAEENAKNFLKAEEKFKKMLKDFSVKHVEKTLFAPIVLDLYNKNRNVQSVINDSDLRNDIKVLHNSAHDFVDRRGEFSTVSWTLFVSFILRYNKFELANGTSFPKEKLEELFSTKKTYQKFTDIFIKFIKDNERFDQYAYNQLEDWLKLGL